MLYVDETAHVDLGIMAGAVHMDSDMGLRGMGRFFTGRPWKFAC